VLHDKCQNTFDIREELGCLLIAADMQLSNYTVYHLASHLGNWYSSYSSYSSY